MADRFSELGAKHIELIKQQHMFFVATAGNDGRVNLSPKGMDSFRVIDETRIVWLNLTGSGNETATHVAENPRMTIMFCSFDKQPVILRLYGQAEAVRPNDAKWNALAKLFPEYTGARQIFDLHLDLVQSSCGFAVPMYNLVSERQTLVNWAEKKGEQGIREYWEEKNTLSLDGLETGILD